MRNFFTSGVFTPIVWSKFAATSRVSWRRKIQNEIAMNLMFRAWFTRRSNSLATIKDAPAPRWMLSFFLNLLLTHASVIYLSSFRLELCDERIFMKYIYSVVRVIWLYWFSPRYLNQKVIYSYLFLGYKVLLVHMLLHQSTRSPRVALH